MNNNFGTSEAADYCWELGVVIPSKLVKHKSRGGYRPISSNDIYSALRSGSLSGRKVEHPITTNLLWMVSEEELVGWCNSCVESGAFLRIESPTPLPQTTSQETAKISYIGTPIPSTPSPSRHWDKIFRATLTSSSFILEGGSNYLKLIGDEGYTTRLTVENVLELQLLIAEYLSGVN